jgi:hypothetical protein
MVRASALALLFLLASPSRGATLYTTGISRGGAEYLECKALNVGSKPVEISIEIRAVTSPPPDFVVCVTQTVTVVPGRIGGAEAFASNCGAAGPYYAKFDFRGSKNKVRAWCYALEDEAQRAEAR